MRELLLAAALMNQPSAPPTLEPLASHAIILPTADIHSPIPEEPLPAEAVIVNDIIDGFLNIDKDSAFYQDMLDKQRTDFHNYFSYSYTEDINGYESYFEYFPEGRDSDTPIDKITYLHQSQNILLDDGSPGEHLQAAMTLRIGEDGTLEDTVVPEKGRFSRDQMIELSSKYLVSVPPLDLAEWKNSEDGDGIYKDIVINGIYMSIGVSSDGLLIYYQETIEVLE